MAAQNLADDDLITGINVTPLVDVTLVLLVILMVTGTYIASRAIPMELPRGATGESTPTVLTVSIDTTGELYLDAEPIDEAGLRRRIALARQQDRDAQAVIAADGRTSHAQVVHVIDLLRQEQVTRFAINVAPEAGRQ
ncbi:MAG: biopolymer transporter ExbD [Deltaproteobacteria bacterium]|nr:biopolymer transporter ExbD [Kofleriaceae bacterium]